MFCEQCGAQVPDNTKFCPSCGFKLDSYDMPTQPVNQGTTGVQGQPQQGTYPQTAPGQVTSGQISPVQTPPGQMMQGQISPGPMSPGQIPPGRIPPGQMMPGQVPPKKKSHAWLVVLIILVIVIGGIVAGIFFLKNKVKEKLNDLGLGGIITDTENMIDGWTGNYDSRIRIPDGAEPVIDANLLSLVGTYEGEFQCTALEGMENIPGAPADEVKKKVDEALGAPAKCTLEIEDDGDWELDVELLGGMRIDARDWKIDDPKTAGEGSAHLIQLVNGGEYDIEISQTDEIDDKELGSGTAEGKFVHSGVYCEKDGKNLIAGFMSQAMNMNGITLKVEGYFTVDKTSGDYVPEGGEEAMAIMNGEDDDGYGDSGMEDDEYGDNTERENTNSNVDQVNETDDTASGNTSGDPSQTAIRDGSWDILQSGEFQYYDKNNKPLSCAWAEDEGGYYYLGPDECLVYNNYSHDGYWVDKNGCWDSSVPKVDLQFEPLNNTYVGDLWTLDVYMDDRRSGTAKWWYTNTFGGGEPKKYDFTIKQLGTSSYAAYSNVNENEIYLISVVDDGWTLILSSAGQTDTLKIQ
ncbi:MAG: zinc-ribbon domain-containing protein [Lachnospiraceae bacterium]|nr:zinc-ribbon domain-containing protein [Lachnospiraceae bacterium]